MTTDYKSNRIIESSRKCLGTKPGISHKYYGNDMRQNLTIIDIFCNLSKNYLQSPPGKVKINFQNHEERRENTN